jgi:hypothetical protein
VQTGFMSVSLRSMVIILGGIATHIGSIAGPAMGFVRDVGTAGAGLAAGGAFGIMALAQGMGVAALAGQDLQKAFEGDDEALARLTQTQFRFIQGLDALRPKFRALRKDAADSLLPGVGRGIARATPLLDRARPLVRGTGRAIGGLASRAGGMLGSEPWGRDFTTIGRTNIRIIRMLGGAGLNLADALRNILVPAAPLAEWLAKSIRDGSRLVKVWAENSRASGKTAAFWHDARINLALLWKIGKQFAGGVINLFGTDDTDGRKVLRTLDRITARFEKWSNSPDVQRNLGKALEQAMPIIAGKVADAVAEGMVNGIVNGMKLLGGAFQNAGIGGKLLIGSVVAGRIGLFGVLGRLLMGRIAKGMGSAAGPAIGGALSRVIMRGGIVTGMRGALMMLGRRMGIAIAIGAGIALGERLGNKIDRQLDFLTSSMGAADRDPKVQRLRRHVNKPSTQQAMRRWEAKHFNVLDRFGVTWSEKEKATLERLKYPGLDPGRHRGSLKGHGDRPIVVQVDRREVARANDNHRRREQERR